MDRLRSDLTNSLRKAHRFNRCETSELSQATTSRSMQLVLWKVLACSTLLLKTSHLSSHLSQQLATTLLLRSGLVLTNQSLCGLAAPLLLPTALSLTILRLAALLSQISSSSARSMFETTALVAIHFALMTPSLDSLMCASHLASVAPHTASPVPSPLRL